MKRFIDVHSGEVMAGQGNVILKSNACNECLVIAAYDSARKIGCLAHAFFCANETNQDHKFQTIFDPANAIDKMIEDMTTLGASRDDIEVCLVTGENVPREHSGPLCDRNITSTFDLLRARHIHFKENTTVPADHAHVFLDVESGCISYK